jgi:putative transposase
MQSYAPALVSPPNWPVVSSDRWLLRTRDSGRNSRRMPSIAVPGSRKNASRGWTSPRTTVPRPCSTPDARDYTFQCDSRVSVGTLNGRISITYQGYEKHIALMRQGGTIGDAKLWYDRSKQRFYLLVSLTIDLPDPTPAQLTDVVGVDVGMR